MFEIWLVLAAIGAGCAAFAALFFGTASAGYRDDDDNRVLKWMILAIPASFLWPVIAPMLVGFLLRKAYVIVKEN